MATISRSPTLFLQRKGIEPTHRPRPRFAASQLLVNSYTLDNSLCENRLAEGDPAPDRPQFFDWYPPSEEESED